MSDTDMVLNEALQACPVGAASASLRLALYPGEVLRIPRSVRHARVLAGTAWITLGGRDVVLGRGESADLWITRDAALVSGVGVEALLFELW